MLFIHIGRGNLVNTLPSQGRGVSIWVTLTKVRIPVKQDSAEQLCSRRTDQNKQGGESARDNNQSLTRLRGMSIQ